MSRSIKLPPLDTDCEHCTGPAGEKAKHDNRAAWRQWDIQEQSAYDAFCAERESKGEPEWMHHELWVTSPAYLTLLESQPEELADLGCVECDWTGKKITDAGRQVLDFLRRHTTIAAK